MEEATSELDLEKRIKCLEPEQDRKGLPSRGNKSMVMEV